MGEGMRGVICPSGRSSGCLSGRSTMYTSIECGNGLAGGASSGCGTIPMVSDLRQEETLHEPTV